MIDIHILFSVISICVGLIAIFPYIIQTFRKTTEPHPYTWLIWTITQGIATAGLYTGDGGIYATANMAISTTLAFTIFVIASLRGGLRNITHFDTIILVCACCAIVVWLLLDEPLISVGLATVIDLIGYIPTYRKTYHNPWGEYIATWIGFNLSYVFAIAALYAFNWLTLTYLVSIFAANLVLILLCLIRRRTVHKTNTSAV